MDEMLLLREFAKPSELPGRDDLAQARAKLVAATIGTADREPATVHPFKRRKRVLWGGLTAVGLAAAITAAVALAPADNAVLPVPQASAVVVLRAAAAAALKLPDTPPRPDQFLYTKSQRANGLIDERWSSADGTRDSLSKNGDEDQEFLSPGCKNGKQVVLNANDPKLIGTLADCTPFPAYNAALPTTADGMVAYLAGQYGGTLDNVNGIGKDVRYLLGDQYVRPDQRAALLEAVAKIPGLGVDQDVKDLAGRSGVGIFWESPGGGRSEFVFDRETYQYLGTETEAVLAYAIVDNVRDRS
ncbi:MAG: hypothetical protein QOI21_5594 [Actinomycetota bacterium]|jgi:hypothetical protein|nr:hypothetical protein [Actinomycetota bacterium]